MRSDYEISRANFQLNKVIILTENYLFGFQTFEFFRGVWAATDVFASFWPGLKAVSER